MILDHVLTNFQANEQQLMIAEQKVSTGQAFSQPSDAPFDAATAVGLRQRIGLNDQLQRNLDQAQGWLQATDSALGTLTDNLQRARQLALQATNDTYTPADRQKIADEVHQLLLSSVDVGNSSYAGQFLFAGTKTTTQPFLHDGSANSGNLAMGAKSPVSYVGDTGAVTRQIDRATQLQVNADGTQLKQVMNTLAQLEYDLDNSTTRLSGDVTGIDGVNGRLTANPTAVSTFSIDGVAIGTNQTITLNGQSHTVVGFAPGTLISTVVDTINQQIGASVHASIDSNGVLVLQALNGQPIQVSNVDQATVDAVTNADLTNGTGVPVSTGGSTAHDLGLTDHMQNTVGSADIVALDKQLAAVLATRSDVGAKTNRVQSGQSRLQSLGVTLAGLDSKVEDVDMAKALSDLATSQTTFQAALGAAAKVLPPTLLDFLR
jgi:flagellar hook-associated protein 3 FlgL